MSGRTSEDRNGGAQTDGVVRKLRRPVVSILGACVVLCMLALSSVIAGDRPPITASEGRGHAESAAVAWAADAELVYVENDEPLDGSGLAPRWGYLFRSASEGRSRGYSVERGKVVQATDLGMRFEAPPLGDWIDSDQALLAAEEKEGARFRSESGAELSHMVLVRSATDPRRPERTSWLVVYRAPGVPALFVLVDAASGDVDRTWRG